MIALLNKKDRHHHKASKMLNTLLKSKEVWTTELVLSEIGNALSRKKKQIVISFINNCYKTANIKVIHADEILFKKALELYGQYLDKQWGLTDCVSFILMKEKGINIAFTADNHFVQAGFEIVLN